MYPVLLVPIPCALLVALSSYSSLSAGPSSSPILQVLDPGVVGGLVLPVLGALPDAFIIGVSGMAGSLQEAQVSGPVRGFRATNLSTRHKAQGTNGQAQGRSVDTGGNTSHET